MEELIWHSDSEIWHDTITKKQIIEVLASDGLMLTSEDEIKQDDPRQLKALHTIFFIVIESAGLIYLDKEVIDALLITTEDLEPLANTLNLFESHYGGLLNQKNFKMITNKLKYLDNLYWIIEYFHHIYGSTK